MIRLVFLLIPLVFAIFAVKTDKFYLKALQTLACIGIIIYAGSVLGDFTQISYLAFAFSFSILGDYFLSYKEKYEIYYILGIDFFFFAHVMYLIYCMSLGFNGFSFIIALIILLIIYIIYFVKRLIPVIDDKKLLIAVLLYLIISCIVLAIAISSTIIISSKILIIISISLILLSDTIIAETDFIKNKKFSFLILPTYYIAQILLSATVLLMI